MGLITQTSQAYYQGLDGIMNTGDENYGDYQFTSLTDVINQFLVAYVGEDKIISSISINDVQFWASRAMQELSFDTFKSIKGLEIVVPPSLSMPLPQDYVNYTKLVYTDASGIEHVIYPAIKTSNPLSVDQNADGSYKFDANDLDGDGDVNELLLHSAGKIDATATAAANTTLTLAVADDSIIPGMIITGTNVPTGTYVVSIVGTAITMSASGTGANTGTYTFFSKVHDSRTRRKYAASTPKENDNDYDSEDYWPSPGNRFGIDPQHSQANGSFYIDEVGGRIHFSSNMNGRIVILKYISDSLGTDGEMRVHKFAEEALYKWIAYGILSTRANIPENIVARYKKEKFAETRKAKLRLSNIKIEEITQILRGKSKQIKH